MTKNKILLQGIYDVLPLLLPVIPFGIIFGVIGVELGFGPYVTFASSFIIFAGSSQIVFIQLLSAGASSLVTITSVGIVNSRHLLYGAVFAQYLDKLRWCWKILLSYLLTDQAFAVSNKYFKKNHKQKYFYYHLLGSGITLWVSWQLSTLLGIVLGSIVPDELGLSFTIPLTFIGLLVGEFRKWDHVLVMMVSGCIAMFAFNMPFKAYIIVAALSGLFIAYLINRKNGKK